MNEKEVIEKIKIEKQFLKEYELLCQKYKMGLKGCGCCHSPWLNHIEDVNYNEKFNKIFIGGDGYWNEVEFKGELEEENKKLKDKTIDEYFNDDKSMKNLIEIIVGE